MCVCVFQACWHQCRPPMGMGTEVWWPTLPESSSKGPTTTTTHIVSQFSNNKDVLMFRTFSSSYGWCHRRNDVVNLPMAVSHISSSVLTCFSVPGVSGSSVATGNGSGSILLNFDNEEQTTPSSAGQPQQRLQPLQQQQQQQQQHGRSSPDIGVSC